MQGKFRIAGVVAVLLVGLALVPSALAGGRTCRGSVDGGFFNHLSERGTTCLHAFRLMRTWGAKALSGHPPAHLYGYRCTHKSVGIHDPNGYEVVNCTARHKHVRFNGSP
ncbi:MAG: hypothetical protein J2O48_05450 [Solirubrobacterales bacterium]|nr:hypothetical protein [Solirubrobacterales bacterium]